MASWLDKLFAETCIVLAALAGLLLVMVGGGVSIETAQAHCVGGGTNQILSIRNDRFWNFDYEGRSGTGDCNIDWPVNFLFYNNAAKLKVKNRMSFVGYTNEGSQMWGRLDDSAGMDWNPDNGKKNEGFPECIVQDAEHFRVYAVYTDNQMYNVDWGYYVLGTSHIDAHECGDGPSGQSETAESRIADDARNAPAMGAVIEDDIHFYNYMPFAEAEDGHIKQNSGNGASVFVD